MAKPRSVIECAHCQIDAFETMCSDYINMRELIGRSPLVLVDAFISLRNMTGQVVCRSFYFLFRLSHFFWFLGAFIGGWQLWSLFYGAYYRDFSYRLLPSSLSIFRLLSLPSSLPSCVRTCPQMGRDRDRRGMGQVHYSGMSSVTFIISAFNF